jgi:hypothetical protein
MLRSAGLPVERLLAFVEAVEEAGEDAEKLSAVLHRTAADQWLSEALCWQNPQIVSNWLRRYAAEGVPRGARVRKKLRELGAYLQRYTTKNETVGFYGPTGWALVDPASDCTARAGGGRARVWSHTAFEPWAIVALTRIWAADPEVRWYLPVVVSQAGVLDGQLFRRPRRGAIRLTPDQRTVVEALAARPGTATELLGSLGASWDRDRLGPILEDLHKADCLSWGFCLPIERGLEEHVLAQLRRLPEGNRRSTLLNGLQRFLQLREEVALSLGDADKTMQAMNRLGEAFETATGLGRAVLKKDNPDSRSLLYHDVAVDWDAVVGARSLAVLGPPLELLLAVSRYVTWRLAGEVDDFARSALVMGDDSFEAVFDELAPVLTGRGADAVARKVVGEVHAKVEELLNATEPEHSTDGVVAYRSELLRERWLDAFDVPRHGWTAALTHSPDMMLAQDGDRLTWVLGELHMAMNPLDNRFCLDSQPEPGQLEKLIDAATPLRHIPAFPDHWPRKTPRTYPPPAHHIPHKHRYWTLWPRSVVSPSVPKLSGVDLTVADRDGEVLVLGRAGEPVARLVDFVGEFLSVAFSSTFSLRPKAEHQRRITIDGVVVQRRTWWFRAGQLLPSAGTSLRGFFESNGIPRYTFVRVPGEPKPVFCDVRGSITTDNIVRMLRKVADLDEVVQVQEMIPDVEHLWLRGADGHHVTSEFRFVVQDMRGYGSSV